MFDHLNAFNAEAVNDVSDKVTASLPKPLNPEDPIAVETSLAVPVSNLQMLHSQLSVVKPSIVFNVAAATLVSVTAIVLAASSTGG